MSVNVPYKSVLDIAKERLSQFKVRYDVTLDEMAKLMGLANSKPLQDLMKAKGSHYLSDNVIAEFGSQGASTALAKLKAMRPVAEVKVQRSFHDYRKPSADDVNLIEAMDAFVKKHGVPDSKASKMLGYAQSYFGQVRNRIKNESKVPHLKILKAIADYDGKQGKSATVEPKVTHVSDISESVKSENTHVSDIKEAETKARDLGRNFVVELFGVCEHDLRALAPEIDILLAAKRHGTPFKIVVGR